MSISVSIEFLAKRDSSCSVIIGKLPPSEADAGKK
jgi:hypothetical protein